MGLAGCTTLPHDGPSANSIIEAAQDGAPYALVDLDYRVSQIVTAHPARALGALAPVSSAAPVDLIGEGDILSVQVFQPGMGPAPSDDNGAASDGGQSFPNLANAVTVMGEVRTAGRLDNAAFMGLQSNQLQASDFITA